MPKPKAKTKTTKQPNAHAVDKHGVKRPIVAKSNVSAQTQMNRNSTCFPDTTLNDGS